MPTDAEKLATLRTLAFIEVAELVKVSWPSPDGDVYYASTLDPYLFRDVPIDTSLIELRLPGRAFQEILKDAAIADDKVTLKLWDADGAISDLAATHGPGERVEILYYFPQVQLLLSQWFGHLQPATAGTVDWYNCEAAEGFLSSMLTLPRRAFFNTCQAIYGGLLTTQAEINEGDCQYNRHLAAGSTTNPSYQNNANGTVGSNGAFSKSSGGNAWNCGASHDVQVNDGDDVSIIFKVSAGFTAVGFVITPSPINGNTDFLFGLQFNPAGDVTLRGVDSGHSWPLAATWTPADTFQISLRAGLFGAFKSATKIAPTGYLPPAPAYPLNIGIAIFTSTGGISEAHMAIGEDIGAGAAFGNLDPATSQPYPTCPRNRAACIARLGDDLSYLGFDTVIQSYTVNQTKGANITVTTRGNESNLKRPLRVIAGQRHVSDLDLLAFTVEPDTRHPEGGAVACLFAECEGPIKSQANQKVAGVAIGAQHLNARNGERRQARTGFSASVSNYSSTALFFGRAQGDFTKTTADQLTGEVDLEGLCDVRRYTSETVFVEEYSRDRAWWLLHCLRNKRWGHGLDVVRFEIEIDWIRLAGWGQRFVSFTDADGTHYTGQRTTFNAELIDRSTQQQINDICLAGRYGLPYVHRGKLRISPLDKIEIFSAKQITRYAFLGALAREPASGESSDWLAALNAAGAISDAALLSEASTRIAGLFASGEYTARGRTDEEFVADCYGAYLNRAPDAVGGANHLAIVIASGRTYDLGQFSGSDEFRDRLTGADIQKFSDNGTSRNICLDKPETEGGRSTLVISMLSDAEVPNRIDLTFDDSAHGNAERPLVFEDEGQQLRAGRTFGDTTRRVVPKPYAALGVTDLGEVVRLGNLLLHLGEFDEGGTENNLRVEFTAWLSDCLELHKYQIIHVDSARLDRYGFKYFRIRSLHPMPDLKVQISAQAYPEEYYDLIESPSVPPPIIGIGGDDNPGGDPRLPPFHLPIASATFDVDRIIFRIEENIIT